MSSPDRPPVEIVEELSDKLALASTYLLQMHSLPQFKRWGREMLKMSLSLTGNAAALARIAMLSQLEDA